MSRLVRASALLGLAIAAGSCRGSAGAAPEEELAALRAEVQALRDSATVRARAFSGVEGLERGPTTVAVGLRIGTLREIVSGTASRYLDAVQLHIRPDAVVRTGDDLRVRVGPASLHAGRWDLTVTVRRVDALLRAGAIDLRVQDGSGIDLLVPVHVRDATGEALIEFRWDAAPLASVACADFAVREPFEAFAASGTQVLHGHIGLESEGGVTVARPVLRNRIFVSPQPTEQSWQRVRQILQEQNHIFNCGLALSPPRVEAMLRDLLERGFRFTLPSSVLRPVPLPGSVASEVEIGGRRVRLEVQPELPRVLNERLWLSASVRPTGDGSTLRIQPSTRP